MNVQTAANASCVQSFQERLVDVSIRKCSVCQSETVTMYRTIRGYPIWRCRACTHQMATVDEEPLDDWYGESYYERQERGQSIGYDDYLAHADQRVAAFHDCLRDVELFAPRKGRLLDIGCAVGLAVKVAKQRGWQPCGIDRSRWAIDYGSREFGLELYHAAAEDDQASFPAGSFDAVTLWDALEHLVDPRATLTNIVHWLRPEGVLALNTVDAGSVGARWAGPTWRHYCPPVHLQYFTRRSLQTLLAEFGFKVLRRRAHGVLFDPTTGRRQRARQTVNRIVNHWRLAPLVTPLGLRDEVFLIASRRQAAR